MAEQRSVDIYEPEEISYRQYLVFSIGEDEYGLEISNVTDIHKMQEITLVPGLPENVRGIINVRGDIIPVVDVRLRFGYAFKEYAPRTCIITLEEKGNQIGLIVDGVNEVATVRDDLLIAPSGVEVDGVSTLFISHITRRGDVNMRIVDSYALLNQAGVLDVEPQEKT